MAKPQNGDTVRVHYTGRLEDGTEFDSSVGKDPLEFQVGQGQLIAGFEQAVVGLAPGETCSITLQPAEGYGESDPSMIQDVPRQMMPQGVEMHVGMVLQGKTPDGRVDQFVVLAFDDDAVRLDGNHPLAGKVLNFDIELVEIA
jgi:peptidylprolyl isomerase